MQEVVEDLQQAANIPQPDLKVKVSDKLSVDAFKAIVLLWVVIATVYS